MLREKQQNCLVKTKKILEHKNVQTGRYSRNPPDDVHIGRVTADIGRVTAKVALTTIKQRIKHGFRGFSGC